MSKSEKYILVNLEDEKSKKIAESISNKTARKILDYLSNKEESGAEEISKELKLPISTIDYNLKNLKKAGIIGIISIIIQYLTKPRPILQAAKSMQDSVLAEQSMAFDASQTDLIVQNHNYGLWFFFGALFIIVIYFLIKIVRSKD